MDSLREGCIRELSPSGLASKGPAMNSWFQKEKTGCPPALYCMFINIQPTFYQVLDPIKCPNDDYFSMIPLT